MLQGCTLQSEYLDIEAGKLGFSRKVVKGRAFQHVIYFKHETHKGDILHVYLDGDGEPWINHRLISADPTPVNPLMLKLMDIDQAPSIYLGRPCYHGFATTPSCNPELWTSARYSLQVVESMQQALQDYMARGGYRKVVLIGHSGGGTLAMLLAGRVNATRAVVTIAGNLDIDAWAKYHAYSPLNQSLNPATMPALDAKIFQYHLIGKADRNVPFPLVENFLKAQSNARVLIWDKFDHACCWQDIWQEFLQCLDSYCS